jgi:hypothetical protein
MEGGDLLGAYDRACDMAELNARLAGIANPISALHAMKKKISIPHEFSVFSAPERAPVCSY